MKKVLLLFVAVASATMVGCQEEHSAKYVGEWCGDDMGITLSADGKCELSLVELEHSPADHWKSQGNLIILTGKDYRDTLKVVEYGGSMIVVEFTSGAGYGLTRREVVDSLDNIPYCN